MNDLNIERPSLQGRIALYLLVFFRYAVLCSSAIACYCLCYLAYEHNTHYCIYYPYACTEDQKRNSKVPWPVILFITTCAVVTLESLFSAFHTLSMGQGPNYARLLKSTTPVTALFMISYWSFYKLPSIELPCPFGPNNYRNLREAPETYDCCIAFGVIVAGGIAVFFQLLITVVATIRVTMAKFQQMRIELPEASTSGAVTADNKC